MPISTYRTHRKIARFCFDRSPYLSQILTRRHAISFSHGFPSSGFVIVKILDRLKLRISTQLLSPSAPVIFFPLTEQVYPPQPANFINGRCINIGKDIIAKLQEEAFGYGYIVDPQVVDGPYVRKSITNAAHDGIILYGPVAPEPGFIYQKLIDTQIGDEVEEIRLLFVGRVLDICYLKRHPIAGRFAIPSSSIDILQTSSIVSASEINAVQNMARLIGMEYGEIDAMRDKNTGLLYVIDMNRTPGGPPFRFTQSETERVVKILADAFLEEFSNRIFIR